MRNIARALCRFPNDMIRTIVFLCILGGWLPCFGERLYVNDLPAPESLKDVRAIEDALKSALPKARAATVCIEIGQGSGSGVIVSEDGLILSAAHVTAAVGKKVKIKLEDGTEHTATTLGLVADTDAAMAKIDGEGPFPHIEMETLKPPNLGDWVFSLGHSGGFDKERGVVVRIGRLVKIQESTFQSDCILIGGDSGGPLFDMNGKLIGIHSRVGGRVPVNMHVPMAVFQEHWDGMLASEFIGDGPFATRPVKGNGFLGFASEAAEGGLRVTRVGSETPAEEAGLKAGDVILQFNGKKVTEREQIQEALKEMVIGDEVTLEIRRGKEEKTLTFPLGKR